MLPKASFKQSPIGRHDDTRRRTRRVPQTASESTPKLNVPRRPKKTQSRAMKQFQEVTLLAPLSILTENLASTPIRDMGEWANRPLELRQSEAQSKNGRVARPMNSFMLYRLAYADRVKQWSSQNNPQLISAICGESWPLEPQEIRDLYCQYAETERINHQSAHPAYKFIPRKHPKSRRNPQSGASIKESDPCSSEGEWSPICERVQASESPELNWEAATPTKSLTPDFQDTFTEPTDIAMNVEEPLWEMDDIGMYMPVSRLDTVPSTFENAGQTNMTDVLMPFSPACVHLYPSVCSVTSTLLDESQVIPALLDPYEARYAEMKSPNTTDGEWNDQVLDQDSLQGLVSGNMAHGWFFAEPLQSCYGIVPG